MLPKRDKYVQTADHGLVILGVTDRESGRYDCRLGPGTVFSYTVEVDASKLKRPLLYDNFTDNNCLLFARNVLHTQ